MDVSFGLLNQGKKNHESVSSKGTRECLYASAWSGQPRYLSKAEWELVQKTLVSACAADYKFHWSLADWKYSGTTAVLSNSICHVGVWQT